MGPRDETTVGRVLYRLHFEFGAMRCLLSSLFVVVCRRSSLFVVVRCCSLLFVVVRPCSCRSLFVLVSVRRLLWWCLLSRCCSLDSIHESGFVNFLLVWVAWVLMASSLFHGSDSTRQQRTSLVHRIQNERIQKEI